MTGTVRLTFKRGLSRPVSAHIYGPLAVHRRFGPTGERSDGWVVTHIRSGCRLFPKRLTYAEACSVARESRDLDWDWGTPGKSARKTKRVRATVEALKVILGRMGLL